MPSTPSLFPPSNLLQQVEGIEQGLRRQRRLGALGWVGVVVAVVQAMAVVIESKFWDTLTSQQWHKLLYGAGTKPGLLDKWPFLVALGIFLLSVFTISWRRFWLKESEAPFRYTFGVEDFAAVTSKEPYLVWLRHHLSTKLNERIRRLSLLEGDGSTTGSSDDEKSGEQKRGAPPVRYESHINISGHYGRRVDTKGRWIIEVVPRVRIGPKGSAETLAHTVTFRLNPAFEEQDSSRRLTEPHPLDTEQYEKLLERVYFSIATEIYRQIGRDVKHKIDLLPTSYLRATAYFHEARDYARSNTLVAYDEAQRLYDQAIKLYDPAGRPWPTSWIRRPAEFVRRIGSILWRWVRYLGSFVFRRMAKTDVMLARARIGYANVLMDRRILAGLSGYRINPIFETRPVTEDAIKKLKWLPQDVDGVRAVRFDAYVTRALAWVHLGSARKAERDLDFARQLLPSHATEDARFVYVEGQIETRTRSRLLRFQRAVELDSEFESAQFLLALEAEMLWRTRSVLEADVAAGIYDEYERVLTLNPGNIAAWANLGYMHWLLAWDQDEDRRKEKLADAERSFERALDYKAIKRETFVAEIEYGLARISAELGDFAEAYSHFTSALTAHMAQEVSQGYSDSWSSLSDYYFYRTGWPILQRFERYKDDVERVHADRAHSPELPPRVRDSVLAFVVNDYGEACYNYFKRSNDERYLEAARGAYGRSAELDPSYAIPRHNLYLLNKTLGTPEGQDEAVRDAEKLYAIEPDWSEAKLAMMWKEAADAASKQQSADVFRRKRIDQIRRARSASVQATEKDIDASAFVAPELPGATAQPEAVGSTATQAAEAYLASKQAQDRATEAVGAARSTADFKREQQAQLREATAARNRAATFLRDLLPHDWLWKGRLLKRTPERILARRLRLWRRWRLRREGRWEREFNDIHVKALYEWGWALVAPIGKRRSPSGQILAHVEEHFWQDNFDLVRHFRSEMEARIENAINRVRLPTVTLKTVRASPLQARRRWRADQVREYLVRLSGPERVDAIGSFLARVPGWKGIEFKFQERIDKYNRILARTIVGAVERDPSAYWALYWLGDGHATITRAKGARLRVNYATIDVEERDRLLRRVVEQEPQSSPALFRWLGEQLEVFQLELRARQELGLNLQLCAEALSKGNRLKADEILRQLETQDWRGVEASAVAECRRALKAENARWLADIAGRLRSMGPRDDQAAFGNRLRGATVEAYEAALRSDDPNVLWAVVSPLHALGERARSLKALEAYSRAIAGSPGPDALWALAVAYRELGDWPSARANFSRARDADERRAGGVPDRLTRHPDRYRLEIARALWREGEYEAALTGLEQMTEGVADARTQFVREMLSAGGAVSIETYRKVRTLLEGRQRDGAGIGAQETRRDAGRALLLLARHRREGRSSGPHGEVQMDDSAPMLPLVTPITLEADRGLFREGQDTPLVGRMIETFIPQMRSTIESDVGVRIPGVQIRPSVSPELAAGGYSVKLHEIPLASGTADRGRGEDMIDRGVAPVVRRYLDTYLGFQEVQGLVEQWRVSSGDPDASALIARALPSSLARLRLVQVLQRLVREGVGITDLGAICRAVADSPSGLEVDEVVDRVRKSESLMPRLPGNEPRRRRFGLAPEWEATFERWVHERDGKRVLAVPTTEEHLVNEFVEGITSLASGNSDSPPALVVRDDLRRFVRRLTERWFPAMPVLAQSESAASAQVLKQVPFAPTLDRVAS